MKDNRVDPAEDETTCNKPCDPAVECEHCADYWQRMRDEGFWVDGKGWTDKGIREMCK
jgi:hypothetical protein